jgi:hypothetical protein
MSASGKPPGFARASARAFSRAFARAKKVIRHASASTNWIDAKELL